MLAINIQTPNSMLNSLRDSFKDRRLSFNLTQEVLSKQSGVSLGSVKRFESTGQISLEALLKIAFVLECLDDFLDIARVKKESYKSIDELLKEKPQRKRASKK